MDFQLQKQLAEQLRQQSAAQSQFQAPQGQMVGGHYVAPNVLEYLAAGLRSAGGMKGEVLATQQLADIGKQEKDMVRNETKALSQALRGTPGQMVQPTTPNDDEGNINPQVQMPGTPGSYDAFLSRAMESPLPQFQQIGMQGIMQMPELEAKKQERDLDRQFKVQQAQEAHALRLEMLREQNASRQQIAEENRAHQENMIRLTKSLTPAPAASQPYYQPIQTAQGVMAFNSRTGQMEPVSANGQTVIGATADPALQGAIAGAKSGATAEAKLRGEAKVMAPAAIAKADETVRLIDDLLTSPGFKQAVGGTRMLGVQKIPGTNAKDFDIRLDQLKGQQFLQAFESLKGGGAITEVEGKKATDAIARMDAAGTEAEFVKASREFQKVIKDGAQRARSMAGGTQAAPSAAPKPRMKFDAQGNPVQ